MKTLSTTSLLMVLLYFVTCSAFAQVWYPLGPVGPIGTYIGVTSGVRMHMDQVS